jgi:hypothetical protein
LARAKGFKLGLRASHIEVLGGNAADLI